MTDAAASSTIGEARAAIPIKVMSARDLTAMVGLVAGWCTLLALSQFVSVGGDWRAGVRVRGSARDFVLIP